MTTPIQDWGHDWNWYQQQTEQGKLDQTEIDANFPDDIDGSEFGWTASVDFIGDNDADVLVPDLQGQQAAKTPYVNLHLFP
jgi:hypothetical protein